MPLRMGASGPIHGYQPLGPVLAVTPWNYPIRQLVRFAGPTLMVGKTCLLKHAQIVPPSAMYLDTVFERGDFPVGSFRALPSPLPVWRLFFGDRQEVAPTNASSIRKPG
ncbi:aldehyde dehydrogenase family protein [Rhodococcoides fascians]|uniref:aldehyde dehydrogenase family protein n=1 Tax=Rhodococcoides fascians TaxID=1828 RepID=UPI002E785655|nr:aldehyde dehydrogenase family protein [Rhodococcus fascians]